MSGPRILCWDIETSPLKVYTWSLWPKVIPIDYIIETQRVICFSAKWVGENRIHFRSEFHSGRESMAVFARKLLHEADGVISWNGKAYDTRHMAREFEQAGIDRPSPYADIDLMRAVKRSMLFASNKLDHVARELGLPGKNKVTFDLWLGCMAGDPRAWAEMRRYNKQDVATLERVYERLLPWIPGHLNAGLFHEDDEDRCPTCGSTDLTREGFAYTSVGRFQRYRCRNCGRWSRSGKRDASVDLREVAA